MYDFQPMREQLLRSCCEDKRRKREKKKEIFYHLRPWMGTKHTVSELLHLRQTKWDTSKVPGEMNHKICETCVQPEISAGNLWCWMRRDFYHSSDFKSFLKISCGAVWVCKWSQLSKSGSHTDWITFWDRELAVHSMCIKQRMDPSNIHEEVSISWCSSLLVTRWWRKSLAGCSSPA